MDKTFKRGSVTITGEDNNTVIIITFSRQVEPPIEPIRKVGYDLNEKSIVGSDGTRIDLSEVARLHTLYGVRRKEFYSKHPKDRRLKQKFAGSLREKERVKQFLHKKAKEIVEKAKENQEGIVLERLKGIRYAHKRSNGEGTAKKRRRIALWPFRQLQGYIEYKARWEGVPVEYVQPSRTSQTCHLCGFVNRKLKVTKRTWQCLCGAVLDRDLNAAVNVERRGKIPCVAVVRPRARG
jgi:putative transposase